MARASTQRRSREAAAEAVMQAEDLPARALGPPLTLALIEALDDETCARLAERLGPYLQASPPPDEWLDAKQAAAYLSLPRSTLHKLTAEQAIPFEQEGAGCKLYFKRSALDAWREGR
jgi:excisionase family DNA binding protein